jgi:hypothetical protein
MNSKSAKAKSQQHILIQADDVGYKSLTQQWRKIYTPLQKLIRRLAPKKDMRVMRSCVMHHPAAHHPRFFNAFNSVNIIFGIIQGGEKNAILI